MANMTANIRIDPQTIEQAEELFADFGMDLSTAINIFLRQALRDNAFPFEIRRDTPNDITGAAMEEYNKALSDPVEYKRYSSFKEAMQDVLNDA